MTSLALSVPFFSRLGDILSCGKVVAQEQLVDQSEFLRRKNVRAKIQVVARMVDDLERQHDVAWATNFRVRE
jgi:hypothetical protein